MKGLSKFHLHCFLMLVLVTSVSAQDNSLVGHWIGTITRGDRSGTTRLDLTDTDGKIAGTLSDPSGQVMTIENFKLEGTRFTFDAWAKQRGQPAKLHLVGEVANHEIRLHRENNGERAGPTIAFHRQGQ